MSYCILRIKKLKTLGAVAGSCRHTFRERPTANADASRTELNQIVGAKSTRAVMEQLRKRLPTKRRRDAVLAIEYLIAGSREFFDGHRRIEYFQSALAWLREKHGAQNVLCAAIHLDETTPHMAAYVVPITSDGRLAAKDFVGGARKLAQLQTDFHERVGKRFGLERGRERSKASHNTIRQFYAGLSAPAELPKIGLIDAISGAFGKPTSNLVALREAESQLVHRKMPAVAESFEVLRKQALVAVADARRANDVLERQEHTITDLTKRLQEQAEEHELAVATLGKKLSAAEAALVGAQVLIASFKALLSRALGRRPTQPHGSGHGVRATPLPQPEKRR